MNWKRCLASRWCSRWNLEKPTHLNICFLWLFLRGFSSIFHCFASSSCYSPLKNSPGAFLASRWRDKPVLTFYLCFFFNFLPLSWTVAKAPAFFRESRMVSSRIRSLGSLADQKWPKWSISWYQSCIGEIFRFFIFSLLFRIVQKLLNFCNSYFWLGFARRSEFHWKIRLT